MNSALAHHTRLGWRRNRRTRMLLVFMLAGVAVMVAVSRPTLSERNSTTQISSTNNVHLQLKQSHKRELHLAAQPQAGCCGGNDASENPHLLAGTYYTLNNGYSAKLLLNNKGPNPIDVEPTLFSLSGMRFNVPTLTVGANTHRFVDLREWATLAGPQFIEGSIQLFHLGKDLVLGTQIYLTDDTHSLGFDEKLTELGSGGRRLEGVWWLPSPKGRVSLAISNTTDTAVCALVRVQGESPRKASDSTIELRPHETRLLDLETEILQRDYGAMSQYGAISVENGGIPGAVLARAMAFETSKGYSLSTQFSNPAGAKSSNLQGAGLRIATTAGEPLSAKVVVHNASQVAMTFSGNVPFTSSDGSTGIAQLPALQLSSGETRVINVSDMLSSLGIPLDQVDTAGLELQHSGELGSLITSAFSVSESSNQVFRMPIWDVAAQRSATGGYPWYIDGASSTVVYIKNTTNQQRQFRLYVMYDGGGYLYPLTTVSPHQTNAIDIRALRDNHVPDANGNTIPSSITEGQIEWSMIGGEDRVMIGRSEQVDFSKGVSSNYACMNCCGNSFYDAWITPDYDFGLEGEVVQFTAMQQDANCYGQPFLPYARGAAFGNFIASICQPDSTGSTTLNGLGQTSIQGGWTADSWISWGGPHNECEYSPVDVLRDALCEVFSRDLHFTQTSYSNVSASFVSGAFMEETTLNIGNASDASRVCSTSGTRDFTISVQFTYPSGGTIHDRWDPRNRVVTGLDHQFEFLDWDFDEINSSSGRMHIHLFRKSSTLPRDYVDITLSGDNPPGLLGGFIGKGRVHLSCP